MPGRCLNHVKDLYLAALLINVALVCSYLGVTMATDFITNFIPSLKGSRALGDKRGQTGTCYQDSPLCCWLFADQVARLAPPYPHESFV